MATNGVVTERKTSSSLIAQEKMQAIIRLDETVQAGRREITEADAGGNEMLKGFLVAAATQRIREMITDKMMEDIMKLKGSPLGFKTDESSREKPYSIAQVKDVVIVALLKGARLAGNEFNILAGGYYPTKEQFERRLMDTPGFTHFRYSLGVPARGDKGALVPAVASWKYNGEPGEIKCIQAEGFDGRIPIRTFSTDTVDNILGKAASKLFRRIYFQLTGQNVGEEEAAEAVDATPSDVVDGTFTVASDPPESSPVVEYERRFLEAATLEAADEIMVAAATAGLSEEDVATAKAWHYEALKRIASAGMPDEDARPLEEQPLAGVWSALQKCELKKDAEAIYLEASKRPGLRDEDHEMLKAWLGQTKQRIYDSHGPRAGKQKQMEGVQ